MYQLLVKISKTLVISDAEGATVLNTVKPQKNKTIFWFGWNGGDEISDWPTAIAKEFPNLKISFLFPEAAAFAREKFQVPTLDFKVPVHTKANVLRAKPEFLISFLGEVDIFEELAKTDPELDAHLWDVVRQREHVEGIDRARFESKMPYEKMLWVVKNRLRHHYAILLKKEYGKKFALVGNDWKKYGIDSFPADYDPKSRFQLYANSHLCLDLLSKSSDEALYPRSAEIITHSNGMLQLKTGNSEQLFGDQVSCRTFRNFSDLRKQIEKLTQMEPNEFFALGEKLRSRLATQTKEYNDEHI